MMHEAVTIMKTIKQNPQTFLSINPILIKENEMMPIPMEQSIHCKSMKFANGEKSLKISERLNNFQCFMTISGQLNEKPH